VQRIERRTEDLLLTLASPRHPDSREEFRLVARICHSGREFAVLLPREPTGRPIHPDAAYLVQCWEGAVQVLDESEFTAPALALVDGMECTRGRFFARFGRLYYKDRDALEPLLTPRGVAHPPTDGPPLRLVYRDPDVPIRVAVGGEFAV
jgi:hypothetical protein